MSIFSSWNKALVGKPWIRLDHASTILAGGSPRPGSQLSIHFRADQDHWLSLVTNAVARGVISMTEHDGMRFVRQADLGHWCEASGSPSKVPHDPGEDEALSNETGHPTPVPILDREDNERQPDALDPREHTTPLVLVAAGKLDAASIERATS
ncbi:hypothetical protein [Paraburkholderia silvatlantica]|uniref:hypothetical protein n=1 Tax=Paraburkholderia silvatlantica TaxID=321895 RepID=UPI003750373E